MMGAQSHEDARSRVETAFWDIDPRRSRDDAWTAIERGIVNEFDGDMANLETRRVFHTEPCRRHRRHR
jgi:hypothetical protein